MQTLYTEKVIISVLILCLACAEIQSQSFPWIDNIGSYDASSPSFSDKLFDVEVAETGFSYAVGELAETNSVLGNDTFTLPVGANSAGFVVKYDNYGQKEWSHVIAPTNVGPFFNPKAMEVAIDVQSGDLVVGMIVGGSFTLDSVSFDSVSDGSFLVSRFNDSGTLLWWKLLEGSGFFQNQFAGLEVSSSGNVYLAGYFQGSLTIDSVILDHGPLGPAGAQRFLIKLDSSGDLLESSAIVSLNSAPQYAQYSGGLTLDGSGAVYFLTQFDSAAIGSDTIPQKEFGVFNDYIVVKYDSNLSYQWNKRFRFTNNNSSGHHIFYGNNHLYFTVTSTSSGQFFFDTTLVDSTFSRATMLGKMDTSGTLVEFHRVGAQTGGETGFFDLHVVGDKVYVATRVDTRLIIGNLDEILSQNFNSPRVLVFDDAIDEFSLLFPFSVAGGGGSIKEVGVNSSLDILVGGDYNALSLGIDTFQFSPSDDQDVFIVKRLSCDYLNATILPNDTALICSNNPAQLSSELIMPSVSYQWYYGNNQIPNATGNSYFAQTPGTYSLLISDSICLKRSSEIAVVNGSQASVSLNLTSNTFCLNDSAVLLTGGSPAGGQYLGNGVVSGSFDPQLAGTGTHAIDYVYIQSSGCSDTATAPVTVEAAPATLFFQSFSQACAGDSITLNSGFPAGGSYSGPGVFGNAFEPQAGETGLITLYYTASSISGCSASDSIQVTVNAVPSVAFSLPQDSVCINDGIVSIGSAVPTGGTYGGTGVSGSFFVPVIAGPGAHSITYTYAQSGCEAVVFDTIMVDSVPSIVLEPLDSICVGADSLPLTHASPAGGTYIGSGITNNVLNASLLGVGTHSIQYVFNNACGSDTATSTISIIADPIISITPSQISCGGGNNGSLSASVMGGSGVFDFTWNTGDSSAFISSLSAGTYSVTVDNGVGCITNESVVLTEPSALDLIIDSIDNVVCNGFSNGAAFVSVSGGVAPYSYSWSDGSTNEDITGLSSGQYTLTVTDANACEDSLTISINELTPIAINGTVDSVSCFDGADGNISTLVTGGNGSYSFLWSSGQMSSSVSSIAVGSYTLTVTDTNGCFVQETFNVAQPDSLEITPTLTNASCYGDANGSISLTVNGGTGQKAYQWSNSASGNAISNLTAGTYTVTITDENACVKSASFTIGQPDSITLSINETQSILCFGDSTGELNAASSGGVAPYTYTWSSGGMNPTETNLAAGSYSVTVTDSLGCQKALSFELLQPELIQISMDSSQNPLCIGDTNGYLAVSASGGVGGLSYNWSTGELGPSIGSLGSGTYTVSVSDQNGCETVNSFQLSDPAAISIQFSVTDAQCFGDSNGSISATIANAVVPFNVNWSNGQSGLSIDSLSAGSYSVSVTDANGCTASSSSTVSEPLSLSVAAAVINSTCADDSTGSIALTVNGGSMPYAFNWSSGDTTSSIDTLAPGVYSVTVIDANACVIDSTFNIGPEPLGLTLDSLIDVACFSDSTGSIAVTGFGGNNSLNYTWSDGGVGSMRQGLSAGVYALTIDDGIATCTFDTSFSVDQPQQLQTSVDSVIAINCYGDSGSVFTHTTGGVEPYTLNWSNSSASQDLMNVGSGSYTLSITDSNACVSTFSIELLEPDSLLINPTLDNLVCENEPQGSISLAVTGGTAPYDFEWSTGATDSVITGLMASTYAVTITDSNDCNAERSYSLSFDFGAPVIDLGNDTALCANDSIVLNAAIDSGSYDWSNGSVDSMIIGFPGLTYSVTVTNIEGCSSVDSVNLSSLNLPIFDLGNDTMICGAILDLGVNLQGPENMSTYLWSTGGQQSTETVFAFGVYSLTVTASNTCWYTDSIALEPDTCTGLPDKLSNLDILVFPNPTSDKLYVSYPDNTEPAELRLITFDGKLKERSSFLDQQVLDMSLLPTGVYFLEVRSSTGARFIRRVVKS